MSPSFNCATQAAAAWGSLRAQVSATLATTCPWLLPADALRANFNEKISQDGFLTREPYVSLSQPYRFAPAMDGSLEETRRRFGAVAERPFLHQAQAPQRIAAGRPVIIATGTGSGKTEALLMSISCPPRSV